MTDGQPDFSAIFFETFNRAAHPVRYAIRNSPNLLHDLAFVSSLVHDARLLTPDVQPEDGCVTIALNRDCWELGYTQRGQSHELHIADCQLRLTGVQSIQWDFEQTPLGEPWLDFLWIDLGFRRDPHFGFYLVGDELKCTIMLAQDDWTIHLMDTEMPYLFSQKPSS